MGALGLAVVGGAAGCGATLLLGGCWADSAFVYPRHFVRYTMRDGCLNDTKHAADINISLRLARKIEEDTYILL